jgi:hypothetical protein
MACRRIRLSALLVASALTSGALAGGALAADPPAGDPQAGEAPAAATEQPRLNLGPYGRVHSNPAADASTPLPRFESSVDVLGKAPPPDLNVTMAVWWNHFNISTGSVYGKGIVTQPTVNLVPLVEWLAKKVKEKKQSQ